MNKLSTLKKFVLKDLPGMGQRKARVSWRLHWRILGFSPFPRCFILPTGWPVSLSTR